MVGMSVNASRVVRREGGGTLLINYLAESLDTLMKRCGMEGEGRALEAVGFQ
jgi:hypothetical protein